MAHKPALEKSGISLPVRVIPRAKRNAIAGVTREALKVYLTAPPVQGRANDALIALMADWLGIKRRQIEVLSGASSRNKVVRITGLSAAALQKLAAYLK